MTAEEAATAEAVTPRSDMDNPLKLAREALTRGDNEEALKQFEAAIRLMSDSLPAKLQYANVLRELGRYEEARAQYRDIVAEDPAQGRAFLALAQLSRALDDPDAEANYLEAAAALDPDNLTIPLQIAQSLRRRSRFDEAEATFEAVLAKDAANVEAMAGAGHLAFRRRAHDVAIGHFQHAVALGMDRPDLLIALANALIDQGRDADAKAVYHRLLMKEEGDSKIAAQIGRIARRLGEYSTALLQFEAAAKADPTNLALRSEIGTALRVLNRPEPVPRRDWKAEVAEAIAVARAPTASTDAQLEAAKILIEYGIVDVARPILVKLEDRSYHARQLLLALRHIERAGLAQPIPGEGRIESAEFPLESLRGFIERPVAGSDTLLLVFAGTNHRVWMTFSLLQRILEPAGASVVYVRDLRQRWYTEGIVGLGDDFETTIAGFRELAARNGAKRILAVGNCVGCLGALRYGLSLEAQGVLAISPKLSPRADMKHEMRARAETVIQQMPANRRLRARYLGASTRPNVTFLFGEHCRSDVQDALVMNDVPNVTSIAIPASADPDSVKDLLVRELLGPILSEFVAHGTISPELRAKIASSRKP